MNLENAELRKIRTDLIPNEWTLEYFKGLCDIKMPEAAMVSGEQLLELLKDKERLDWMADEGFDTREQIDEAKKGQL